MSFLPSFTALGASSSSTSSSSSAGPTFKPASLSYFTIFCPALKPPKSHRAQQDDDAEQDPDALEEERESAQILFYTSRARAAPKDRMLRQIGVAKGMIEFCSMVHSSPSDGAGRTWNVHSSKRRMILVEVEAGVWVHASIDLAYTTTTSSADAKPKREFHDDLLPDAWLEEGIRRSWIDWTLLNGGPAHVLSQKTGRVGLERSLEKYFSVWAWSWDLEAATNAGSTKQHGLLAECVQAYPVVPRGPRERIEELMRSDVAQRLGREREMVVLSDTQLLWPPSDAGCFDDPRDTKPTQPQREAGQMDAATKAELLRRVVSHLTGLERERELVRAAAVASTSDGRRRGTSGAIRERGSSSTKRDVRTGLLSNGTGAGKMRVVSSPAMQQRSTSASSHASTTSDSTRWSNWGGMLSGLGKLGLRSSETPARTETPEPKPATEENAAGASTISMAPSDGGGGKAGDVASPLGSLQDAGEKVWNGAELALRGLGASLGLASASVGSREDGAASREAEVSEQERFADASFDTSGAEADASVVTKVSILEPEVDVDELAEALGAEEASHADEAAAQPDEAEPVAPASKAVDDRDADAASIGTTASAKAFPSISVTSAAWYSKAVRSEATVSTNSPQLSSGGDSQDASLGAGQHHDFELDGWGHETAQPFESFRVHVGGAEEPLCHESVLALQEEPFRCTPYRVLFTTRRLLTMVLIERLPLDSGSTLSVTSNDLLDDVWMVLRRMQRLLNDHARSAPPPSDSVGFVHIDGLTQTMHSTLSATGENDGEVEVVADAHCVSAHELMRRHGVLETFSRSSHGKTWTASRQRLHKEGGASQTYMVLAGRKMSIVDCDTELRKLAHQYPSFGI